MEFTAHGSENGVVESERRSGVTEASTQALHHADAPGLPQAAPTSEEAPTPAEGAPKRPSKPRRTRSVSLVRAGKAPGMQQSYRNAKRFREAVENQYREANRISVVKELPVHVDAIIADACNALIAADRCERVLAAEGEPGGSMTHEERLRYLTHVRQCRKVQNSVWKRLGLAIEPEDPAEAMARLLYGPRPGDQKPNGVHQ